jgi:hypothetical protein
VSDAVFDPEPGLGLLDLYDEALLVRARRAFRRTYTEGSR